MASKMLQGQILVFGSRMGIGMFSGLIEMNTQKFQEIQFFAFIGCEGLMLLKMIKKERNACQLTKIRGREEASQQNIDG